MGRIELIVYHKYGEKGKCSLSTVSKYITTTTTRYNNYGNERTTNSSPFMVPTAVGVSIATVILSAIPMLAFAQGGGNREMAMNNNGEEGGAESADLMSHITEDVGYLQ